MYGKFLCVEMVFLRMQLEMVVIDVIPLCPKGVNVISVYKEAGRQDKVSFAVMKSALLYNQTLRLFFLVLCGVTYEYALMVGSLNWWLY